MLLIALAVLSLASSARAMEPKTLTRFHDPVVIEASALPGAVQRSTAELALYRMRDGRLESMPFQFDPCDRRGEVQVTAPPDFVLDGNDQLVFMAKDTGERATAEDLPARDVVEIQIDDPLDGGRGWAYLLAPDPAVDTAATPYVSFDRERQRATSPFYQVDYADGRNFLTALRIAPAAGGSGDNLLRQTRMLGEPTFSLLVGEVKLSFTENNSIVRVDGVRSGPVRAVRKVHLSVDLGSLFPDLPSGTVYTFHYFSSFTTPTKMSVPWLALKALRDFRFENVVEFAPTAAPKHYWDAINADGTGFESNGEATPLTLDRDHDWWAVAGDAGSLLQAFLVPREWTAWGVTRGTVVQRDPAAPLGAGFTLRDMIRLERSGDYDMLQATVILPQGYSRGDTNAAMAMFHGPLKTRATRLERQTASVSDEDRR